MADLFNHEAYLNETAGREETPFNPNAYLAETNGRETPSPVHIPDPDFTSVKQYGEERIKKALSTDIDPAGQGFPKLKTKWENHEGEASTFVDALEAGFEISVSGLIAKGKKPDSHLPENAPMTHRIASQIGTIAGDFPAMIAGTIGGAAAGTAAGSMVAPGAGTVVGGIIGAGAGGNALPEAIRSSLIQAYDDGSVDSFSDFWDKASPVLIDTAKAGLVGAASFGAGQAVRSTAKIATPVISKVAESAAEISTMASVGAALEGRVPELKEFADAAVLVGGLHGATYVGSKIKQIYSKTGYLPHEVIKEADINPKVQEELVSTNKEVPESFDTVKKTEIEIGSKFDSIDDAESVNMKIPKPESKESTKRNLTPEEQATINDSEILSRVGSYSDKESKSASQTIDDVYTNFVDGLNPVKQLQKALDVDGKLDAKDDPYILLRTLKGTSAGLTVNFLEYGTRDFKTGEVNGKPLKEITKSIKNRPEFEEYLIAERTIELNGRGIETGISLEAAEKVVKSGKSKYSKVAKEIYDFNDRALNYLKDSGVLSNDAFSKIREANKSYVPFQRIMDDMPGDIKAGGLRVSNPVKKIKGSDRMLVDPFVTMIKNMSIMIDAAEKNRALKSLAKLSEVDGGSEFITKKSESSKPVSINEKEIAKFLEDHGLDSDAVEGFTVYRRQSKALGKNEIAVFDDGKKAIYELSPDLAGIIEHLEPAETNVITKILSIPAKALKLGTTVLDPTFTVRNIFRDQFAYSVTNKESLLNPKNLPGVNAAIRVVDGITKSEKSQKSFYDYLANGGGGAEFVNIDREFVDSQIYDLNKKTKFLNSHYNVVENPQQALGLVKGIWKGLIRPAEKISEKGEQVGRISEYQKTLARTGSAKRAAFEARDILDFERRGAKTAALTSLIPFLNVAVQGTDKLTRAFIDNPTQVSMKGAAYITIPSLALWYLQKDDPTYQEIPRYQKDHFWIYVDDNWKETTDTRAAGRLPKHLVKNVNGKLYTNDPTVYRFPKPQVIGQVFGSGFERLAEKYLENNPSALDGLGKTFADLLIPNVVPQFALPMVEQATNYNFFMDRPLIPYGQEKLLPELQYTEYTSESAKMLSRFAGKVPGLGQMNITSPVVIDNYIRAWSGSTGTYAVQAADYMLRKVGVVPESNKASTPLESLPYVKSFLVRHPSMSAESLQTFRSNFKEAESIAASYKKLIDTGDLDRAEVFKQTYSQELKTAQYFKSADKAMKSVRDFIELVDKNPKMKPDEKRQIIDFHYYNLINMARRSNETFQKLKESRRER